MKKIALAFVLLSAMQVSAQQAEFPNVSATGFTGIKALNNGETFYTYYFEEKPEEGNADGKFVVSVYSRDLMEMKKIPLEVSRRSILVASAFSGENFMFIFADPEQKTRTLITVDRNGNMPNNVVEENVAADLLKAETYFDMYPLTPNEFAVVRIVSDKKSGYEVERVNTDFASNWSKSYISNKEKWSIRDAKVVNDVLFILRDESSDGKFVQNLHAINLTDGSTRYLAKFGEGAESGLATQLVMDDMKVTLAGVFFNEGDLSKNPSGVLFMEIGETGTISRQFLRPWIEMANLINSDLLRSIEKGEVNVLIEGVTKLEGGTQGYSFIGETFSTSGGGAGTTLTVKDFIVMNFTNDGQIINIATAEKTRKEATVKGTMSNVGKYELAQWLQKNDFFTYRDVVRQDNKKAILYKNDEGGTTKIYTLPFTDSTLLNNKVTSIDGNGEVNEGQEGGKKTSTFGTNKYVFNTTGDTYEGFHKTAEQYNAFVPLNDRLLIYQYTAPVLKVAVRPFTIQEQPPTHEEPKH